MKHYKLIGLTGQSGAGKSTVAEVFAKLGAYVINADKVVAELYNAGSPCLKAVAAEFGQDVIGADGKLDRKLLAQRAFASRERTDDLNRLVHPFVTARLFELLRGAEGIVVFDAPQLFEADADVICDAVVAVTADKDIRVNRIIKRDSLSEEQAMLRVNAQHGEEYFRARADYIIENNFDEESLRSQAEKVYNKLNKG